MNRYEYLQTVRGQLNLYRRRTTRKIWISIEQEPKSKKSISVEEEVFFQKKIIEYLQKYNRRGYRSKVAIQFRFTVTDKNPPQLQTLVKNYMDLICKPVDGSKIRRKYLLLEDDRLVRALFVGYHIVERREKSRIDIEIGSYNDFLQDMQLIDKIENDNFVEDEDDFCTSTYDKYKSNGLPWNQDDEDGFSEPFQELYDWRQHKIEHEKVAGKKGYRAMERMMIGEAQKKLLKISDRQLGNAYALLNLHSTQSRTTYPNPLLDRFGDIYKGYIDLLPICLDLSHIPLHRGESKIFKEQTKNSIKEFKKQYPILIPLLTPVKAMIFITRPDFYIVFDCDNLARKIMPIIVDEMQPPTSQWLSLDLDETVDKKIKEELAKRQKRLAGIKTSIVSYQVIDLPRTPEDPKEGRVRLFLGDGTNHENYWDMIMSYLDDWADSVS